MKIKRFKKQLDQEQLLQQINMGLTASAETSQLLHWTLIYMLVDAYDQQITREAFANLVVAALNAKGCQAGAATLRIMGERVEAGAFTPELLASSIAANLEYANAFRAELAQQYALVKECRGEGDTVS